MSDEQMRLGALHHQDVRATKAIEAAADRDDRYRLLVEAIVDYAIYMLDQRGYIASWNPGAQRFKGYTTDEIIGEHFSRFYTAEDRATDLPTRALHIAATEGRFEQEGWRVRELCRILGDGGGQAAR
ncbi:PAS domain S-box-containing protein [Methylorubrum extorquens]|nr:PAS domain S-box-containing protein [Methylorubrum extorquens]MCP1586945.1 PAS domain S-box-containing protein [Methylorubrum extorquens]